MEQPSTRYEQTKVTFVRIGDSSHLGLTLTRGESGQGPLMISAIDKNSAAGQSDRLHRGDLLVAINGMPMAGVSVEHARKMCETPAVCLTLMRASARHAEELAGAAAPAPAATQQPGGSLERARLAEEARPQAEPSAKANGSGWARAMNAAQDAVLAFDKLDTAERRTAGALAAVAAKNKTGGGIHKIQEVVDAESLRDAFMLFAKYYAQAESEDPAITEDDARTITTMTKRRKEAAAWNARRSTVPGAVDGFVTWSKFKPWFDGLVTEDGYEPRASLRTGVKELKVLQQAFCNVDMDGSGQLDQKEIRYTFRRLGMTVSRADVLHFVSILDKDGDMSVGLPEFVNAMTNPVILTELPPSMQKFDAAKLALLPSLFDTTKEINASEQNDIMKGMGLMERVGVRYLQSMQKQKMRKAKFSKKHTARQSQLAGIGVSDDIRQEADGDAAIEVEDVIKAHVLTHQERAWMLCIVRRAIIIAALAGVLSAVISGLAEGYAINNWQGKMPGWRIKVFNVFMGIIATIVEVALVYRITFISTLKLTQVTGLVLYPIDAERAYAASALVKTALEMGNPTAVTNGIDPLKGTSKFWMLISLIVYKAKRGLTTFLVKLFVKRVAVRVTAKSMLLFAAAPVNMIWNGLTMVKVMRGAQVVAMGPSAATEVTNELLRMQKSISPALALAMLRAIARVIVARKFVHPNAEVMRSAVCNFCDAIFPRHSSGLLPSEHKKALAALTDNDVAYIRESKADAMNQKEDGCAEEVKDYCFGSIKKARRQLQLQMGEDVEPMTLAELRQEKDIALSRDEANCALSVMVTCIVVCGAASDRERRAYEDAIEVLSKPDQYVDVRRLTALFAKGLPWDEEQIITIVTRESPPKNLTWSEKLEQKIDKLENLVAC
eukprot:g2711.t1